MMKTLKRIGMILLVFLLFLLLWTVYNLRDRHRGYEINVEYVAGPEAGALEVGFGATRITPTITDTWTDVNEDARYNEEDGDRYQDVNENGKFDAVWIAGFSNAKAANGVHDDVWSRSVVFDNGGFRLGLVSIDAIGFMHDDVVDIRKMLPDELGIDYLLISSTHTHESNDLIGMWGPGVFTSGVDPEHMEWLKAQVVESVRQAVLGLEPAKISLGHDLTGRDSLLIKDTRKPIVKATGIGVMQVTSRQTGAILGTLVNWANHPETLWSSNLLISSDFPHYIRKSIEEGIVHEGEKLMEGSGGTCIFFNGAVGGLMTPHPSLAFHDPIRDTVLKQPSFAKTQTLGEQIALLAHHALLRGDTLEQVGNFQVLARTIKLPLENRNFRIASAIGLLNRGTAGWFKTRTEIAAIQLGPMTMMAVPGEIYPEIVYGGVESPPGQDFAIAPVEVPPLAAYITTPYNFCLGLANDEIGYIIPKSEWDDEPPWLYLDEGDTYGEENSLGPETAPLLYEALRTMLQELR